jgi:transcriptional regulator with XRE-family HTH domain
MPKIIAPTDKHVGARVRMRRMMQGLSQEKLGNALGVTFQQVQKYEKGTNRIGASRLQQISDILQVPVSFFFEGQPNAAPSIATTAPYAVDDFIASPDGIAIARAFGRIHDPKLKRAIAHMVEQIVESAADAERKDAA